MSDRFDKLREQMQPEWDDVRERRVLARALARKHEEEERRAKWRWPLRLVSVAGALAAAALVAFVVSPELRDRVFPGGPVVRLDDGSVAELLPGGQVEVLRQAADGVQIDQRAGKVRYRVTKQKPGASFNVAAKGVSVRVVGTRFTVELLPGEAVQVAVEEGRVEVRDGKDSVLLGPGEQRRAVAFVEPPPPPPPPTIDASTPDAGVVEIEPPPVHPGPKLKGPAETIDQLLGRADVARTSGNPDEAVRLLKQIATVHQKDPRSVSALFTLGKIESARGRYLQAADAFGACFTRAGTGPLAEDALAERSSALAAAGETARSKESARQYLRLFPRGTHAPRMEVLAR